LATYGADFWYATMFQTNKMKYGRQPQFFWKWQTTSIFSKLEDNLNFFGNKRRPKFLKIEDNRTQPNLFENESDLTN
jgi:hypothetical protein